MPDFETLHGDEEAIEICSDRFYELLDPHFSLTTGTLDLQTPAARVEETCDVLAEEGYDLHDIHSGLRYAVQILNEKKLQLEYI